MGCINTKKVAKENEKELSLSSHAGFSISISELPYIEPIKTKEQIRIEYIQHVFKQEFNKPKPHSLIKENKILIYNI